MIHPESSKEVEDRPNNQVQDNARQALSAQFASELTGGKQAASPAYSLASGELTIYSHGTDSADLTGHAWVAYRPDKTGKTTTYGVHLDGIRDNLDSGWYKTPAGAEHVIAGRTRHIDNEGEKRLMKVVNEQRALGTGAWSVTKNCSTFAASAWNAATGERFMPEGSVIIGTPNTLMRYITNANGGRDFNSERAHRHVR
jgi:hypothetical protein